MPSGSRIHIQVLCPACNNVVECGELVRGYEVATNEYVRFTDAELENLKAKANKNIELKEFIPVLSVDPGLLRRLVLSWSGQGRR